MAESILPLTWINNYDHTADVQALFTWRRGMFGFHLKKQIKLKIESIERFTKDLEIAQSEFVDSNLSLKSITRELERLGKKENSDTDPMFAKLDTERMQLERNLDTKETRVVNLKDSLLKASNDLRLMQNYSDAIILTTAQAMREWTGRDGTDTKRPRGSLPEREPRLNKYNHPESDVSVAGTEETTEE
jgi:hypothetical protein